jgi:hypothetical protein
VRRAAAVLWLAAVTTLYADAPPAAAPSAKPPAPWPAADELQRRREDSETRRLFRDADPVAFTLTADFKAVGKERKPDSAVRFPASMAVSDDDGQTRSIPVRLRTRGHARLVQNCGFVPLRVEFPAEGTEGTAFEGQNVLKLGTHCQGGRDYEQYALREYLAYRIFNVFTPRSFRVRLARATYVDAKSGKTVATRYAMFLEAERDLARRHQARIADLPRTLFRQVDRKTLLSMMLFEYMIGNTDFSIYVRHNVRLLQDQAGVVHPVPYDFDYAGLVHAPYALPARGLGLKTVLDRAYLGPCLTTAEMEEVVPAFSAKKADVLGLVDSTFGLEDASRKEVKAYLLAFYSTIERPADARRLLMSACSKKAGM